MTHVSSEALLEQSRHSLRTLLRWAGKYQPRTLRERTQYDTELDTAEDLLGAIDAWTNRWSHAHDADGRAGER